MNLCLIGENVSHSKSHIIHREFFLAYGTGGNYDLLSVAPEMFDRTIEKVKNHYDGFNITRPYKERVINRLERLDKKTVFRSVNTVKVAVDSTATGYSTDGMGFLRSIIETGVDINGTNILIIGSGGAAKAIAHRLASFTCNIYVYAINTENAKKFVDLFRGRVGHYDTHLKNKYDIIVNCTPVGQVPFINETPLSRDFVAGASLVFDTIYNPPETLLMSYAREEGIKSVSGLDMLIYQGYESQRIWQERDLTAEKLYDTINKIKKEISK